MASLNLLVSVCLGYVALLFLVAALAERAAAMGRAQWLRSPLVYTLSLSVYCTGWTFYGAVGYAARSGLEFVTIYIGPTLVMIGWWWGLRKLVRIGRSQRVTSIADLLSSRYGKSNGLAIGVTILCVISVTPYIALQLQSIALSLSVFTEEDATRTMETGAFWAAIGLGIFAILFGTRNLDANERHHGVVIAVALEAVVKLFALIAVGVFVVWGLAGGMGETLARIDVSEIGQWEVHGGRWTAITLLAAAAVICLPRMFQVMVVENEDERHLRVAAWAFPLYLLLMSLFVIPIAVVGLDLMPQGSNPDLFVLSLPLSQGNEGLAMLAFIGGFSSATSMVIVAAMALSIMISNHVVMPIYLSTRSGQGASISGDVRHVVLLSRRIAIAAILVLGYLYYRLSGGGAALAAIGLIAFAGIAQILPALVGGLFWRGATRAGALAGLSLGFAIWVYTLLLPGFGANGLLPASVMEQGPWGIDWLRPYALFGITGMDTIVHSVLWSLSLNTAVFFAVSMMTFPGPVERLQGAQFVNVFDHSFGPRGWSGSVAQSEDLMIMSQRILGPAEAQDLFQREAERQGARGHLPEPTPAFLETLERELSGSVGTATAHAMVGQIVGGSAVSVEDLLAVADESAQMLEYSSRLEEKSAELTRTAAQLREANEKLTQLSVQKDAFLSQVSHELRTPMTSIRAFSEIMRDEDGLSAEEKARYAGVIHDEALRLTRLLDDLLDLSVLESGQVSLDMRSGQLTDVLDQAVAAALAGTTEGMAVHRRGVDEAVALYTDLDRLAQVFINLIANASKYCDAARPELTIRVRNLGDRLAVDFLDNGSGVPVHARALVFEKFARVSGDKAGGAGLGLAICREILERLGGDIHYLNDHSGGAFRVILPKAHAMAAQ
ncbi:sensor histidine kinase [Aestuariivita boseongensis]|uniref:sensor histidine kinase n=1 Tax=Aestuariivita boseongensis TaxID=1470562 RepID=UPI0006802775|nr:sensor histidine kinase [Aestuariivita boseongensis]